MNEDWELAKRDIANSASSLNELASPDRLDSYAESLSDIASALSTLSETMASIDKHLVELIDRE